MNKLIAITTLLFLFSIQSLAYRGIAFQARLKDPQGHLPTADDVAVTVQLLSPNNCVLREEVHANIDIAEGYLNLNLGDPAASTAGSLNPSTVLTIPEALNNSVARSGLSCVNATNGVVSTGTTYTPTAQDARKVRLRFNVAGDLIVADFNLRSVGYAMNAEQADNSTTLGGRSSTGFIQTSTNITQVGVEAFFAQIVAGTYNAPSATTANNVSGTVAIGNGGTGATSASGARTALGLGTMATESSSSYTKTTDLAAQLPPTPTGHGLSYTRINSGGTAYETRTPAQVLSDILTPTSGALPLASGGTGATTKAEAARNILPTYTSNYILTNDGTNLIWASYTNIFPNFTGNGNKILALNSAGTGLVWASSIAGVDKQIPFNDAGLPNTSASFTWDNTNKVLIVNGQIRHGFRDLAVSALNFHQGNSHRLAVTPPTTFTFTTGSMADGVEYTVILSNAGTYTLPTTNSDGVTAWKCSPACPSNQITTTHTSILKITRVNTDGYVHWVDGFQ